MKRCVLRLRIRMPELDLRSAIIAIGRTRLQVVIVILRRAFDIKLIAF